MCLVFWKIAKSLFFYDNAKERKEKCGGETLFLFVGLSSFAEFLGKKFVGEKVLAPSLILCYNLWDATDGAS